ncbi:MAG: hypothetical protein HRT73_03570 [Flavobacteriales bacterium]|nr:hypothetical protein [Flavobacteriales bacterium]
MTLEERLKYCSICKKRKMNRDIGMICSLTTQKPQFENNCVDFTQDEKEINRKLQLDLNAAGNIKTSSGSSPKYLINLGVVGIVVGALAFFLLGTLWGIVILIIGILLLIKGQNQKVVIAKHKTFRKELDETL